MNARHVSLVMGTLAIAVLTLGVRSSAQGPRPLTLISLAEIPRVLDVQLSPDGRFVSYALARADWKTSLQLTHIWRQPVAGGPPMQLTSGESGELLARWSPDSRSLLYLSRGQIWLIAGDGATPRQLTKHSTGVYGAAQPAWAPDGSSIYFLANDAPSDAERERERLRDDVYVFEQDFRQHHLWKIAVDTGVEQKLTDGPFSILWFHVSSDGTRILEQRAPSPLFEDLGRGETWIKVKCLKRERFVVVGFAPEGSAGIAKLRLARHEGGSLVYVGRVGTGWDREADDSALELGIK
jgi:dipeptidyl aminopeptidase/acylaminoacyl peptidase